MLVIVGPTGVGKTAAAVALGQRIPIEVISADSRQVYRGMDIATGKPTPDERAAVPHHLVDVVDPDDRYHAARFRTEAEAVITDVQRRGRLPVIVGGTGLSIRALLRGWTPPRRPIRSSAASWRESRRARAAPRCTPSWRRRRPRWRAARIQTMMRVIRALERLRGGAGAAQPRSGGSGTRRRGA